MSSCDPDASLVSDIVPSSLPRPPPKSSQASTRVNPQSNTSLLVGRIFLLALALNAGEYGLVGPAWNGASTAALAIPSVEDEVGNVDLVLEIGPLAGEEAAAVPLMEAMYPLLLRNGREVVCGCELDNIDSTDEMSVQLQVLCSPGQGDDRQCR
jgi:hypothetical protein